jgi:hypothetical protein
LNTSIHLQYIFNVKGDRSSSHAVYNFPRFEVYKRPDDGSHLEPNHVAGDN